MPRSHLLVVDADPQSLRVLEVSLRKAGYSVAATHEGRAALRLVEQRPADVVLVDTQLADMDGFALVDALRSGPARDAAVILLASDPSVEARVRGLEHGVDDYVPKPIYINEIIARVQLALQRREHAALDREVAGGKAPFAGALETTSLVDLLQMIEHGRRTGVLYLGSRGERGAVYFRNGALVDAEIGALRGERAVHRALSWNRGVFEAEFRDVRRADVIHASVSVVLMEGMRRLDEWSRLCELLPGLDHVLEVDRAALGARAGQLASDERATLARFDGERSLAEVVYGGDDDELDHLEAAARLWAQRLLVDTGRRARPTQVEARPPGDDRSTTPRTTWDYEQRRLGNAGPAASAGHGGLSASQSEHLAETTPGMVAAIRASVPETTLGGGGSPLARARRMRRERKRASLVEAPVVERAKAPVPRGDVTLRERSDAEAGERRAASKDIDGEKSGTTWPEIPRPLVGPATGPASPPAEPAPAPARVANAGTTVKSEPRPELAVVKAPVKTASGPKPPSAPPTARSPFPLAASRDVAGRTRPQEIGRAHV